MAQQVLVSREAKASETYHDGTHLISGDLAYLQLAIVNVVMYGHADAGDRNWVLIDAGVTGSAASIQNAARSRFGEGARPSAIILTHGHFDHTGALAELAEKWDAPIYAHELELPYLDGRQSYPPPDPTVGGGILSLLAPLYPRGPIDVHARLNPLGCDSCVPGMPCWRWIATPGHSPGHVSLWNAGQKTLIAGDAFITTAQESAYAVATQRPEIHGPPMYYTTDWELARDSVKRLARLEPELVVTGHGPAMQGSEMQAALHKLARDFDQIAVPKRGCYVEK